MRLKTLYASVAGALTLGGAALAQADQYYVLQPASDRVVVEERVVTRPAQPAAVAVPGERMTVTYNVADPYPFPSPENRITQSGVFVPDQPRVVERAPGQVIHMEPERRTHGPSSLEPVITD